jgi:PBSX family phage terminase large subunit
MPDKFTINPNVYKARGAARELWSCRDEEILIEGPAGTGKTRAILEKVNFCAMKYAGMRALLVRKTRESLTESVLVTFEDKVVPAGSPVLEGASRNLRQAYKYPNGSVIVVGGMDKSSKIMSTEYDMICCFEATELTEEDFENLTTRLRNGVMPYQQIVADCNPAGPSHWLNKRASRTMTRLLSRHIDNPMLHVHGKWTPDRRKYINGGFWTDQGKKYIAKLNRLTGPRKLRLSQGLWAAAEGVVYDGYDPLKHIVPSFRIPREWKRIRAIDFGYRSPFVCQWWAISPDGVMYLYREIYWTERIVQEHAGYIMELTGEEQISATVCDHDAEDRATLHEAGIYTIPAYKDIKRGIEYVQKRLQEHPTGSGRMRPRLMLFKKALTEADPELDDRGHPLWTGDEFENYVWKKGVDGKPLKEEPVDEFNHGMDAMRYAVAYVDNLAGMRIRPRIAKTSVIRVRQYATA